MPEYTSIRVTKAVKSLLDSVRHPGQSYSGIIYELVQERRKTAGDRKEGRPNVFRRS